jgi:hypothetical protein
MKSKVFSGMALALILGIIVIGCKENDPPSTDPYTITITGLSAYQGLKIMPFLLNSPTDQNQDGIAWGLDHIDGDEVTVQLVEGSDTEKPWPGEYYVILEIGADITYVSNDKILFNGTNTTVALTDFTKEE